MSRVVPSGQAINLTVQYNDANGNAIMADSTPRVRITDPNGVVVHSLSSDFVAIIGVGRYRYTYTVPAGSQAGDWNDFWVASIGGTQLTQQFTFEVISGGSVEVVDEQDLGDDAVLDECTQCEIDNINCLLDLLKKRLKSTGVRFVRDQFGSVVYDGYGDPLTEECNVFTDDELITFLRASLSEFNSIPHFTCFTFADIDFCNCSDGRFGHTIVTGATLLAMGAQMLIEKGREFVITDNGVSFQPPAVSDIINSQFSTLLSAYRDDLKFIKNQFKPAPQRLGTIYGLYNMVNPRLKALRHFRARQII